MGIANSFAAGVFLTIGFTELLPEAAETFEEYAIENNTNSDYPYSYYVAIGAFCFILFIEKIAFDSHALLHDHDAEDMSPDTKKSIAIIGRSYLKKEDQSENYLVDGKVTLDIDD